jgi:hypothetical protein
MAQSMNDFWWFRGCLADSLSFGSVDQNSKEYAGKMPKENTHFGSQKVNMRWVLNGPGLLSQKYP